MDAAPANDGPPGADSGAPDAGPTHDGPPADDAGDLDATPRGNAAPDLGPGTAVDGSPTDAAPLPLAAARSLTLAEAEVAGDHDRLDGAVLLDPGARLRWTLDAPAGLAALPAIALQVRARIWRVEDGRFEVVWNGEARPVEVAGDGGGGWRWARVPLETYDGPGWGTTLDVPVARLPVGDSPWTLDLVARGGTVEVLEARLVDPRDALPPAPDPAPAPGGTTVELAPCGADCDDGAAINEALAGAPDGPVTIRLAPGRYRLRTPVEVTRDQVTLAGAPAEGEGPSPTVLLWDPAVPGQQAAVRFRGPGPDGPPVSIVGPVAAGTRRFLVDAPPDWSPTWVRISADDFGDVPPVCEHGRDVERFHRHLGQLARVLATEARAEGLRVTLDRPLYLDVPAEAAPRLVAVRLLRGAAVRDLHLLGHCPEALANDRFTRVPCANPEVLDDDGLVFDWTVGARADRVSAQALGKFSIRVQRALETRVADCAMDHPAAFGDGGQGYGVHLITASRTLVLRPRVHFARHGVVVDFGSSDSQVIGARLSRMNQALIDVHGESSRDTLVRGNDLADANLGIIVGGGGREVHCNDGPRHHLQGNTVRDCTLAAVALSDYTRGLVVRGNDLDASSVLFTAAFGAGDALLERNRLGAARAHPIVLTGRDTGAVHLRRNLFTEACTPDEAALATLGATPPTFEGNAFCP